MCMPRRFQFSLRALLVAVTLLCIGIGFLITAETLLRHGGAHGFAMGTVLGWSACGSAIGVIAGRNPASWTCLGLVAAIVHSSIRAVFYLNEMVLFPGYA